MTAGVLFRIFWSLHRERLHNFAVQKALGKWQDAEEGLNDGVRELWQEIVEHFSAVSIEDRTDAKKAILPLVWLRIESRVLDARRRSMIHERPLGLSVLTVETLDDEPAKTNRDSGDTARERTAELLAFKVAEEKSEAVFLSK